MSDKTHNEYYFKIIPKEEFQKFIERLKISLSKIENKKGEKKPFEFEIRGAKEEFKGISLEISTFNKTNIPEFLNIEQEYIKKSLYYFSLNINAKEESDSKKFENFFQMLRQMFHCIPIFKDKYEIHFHSVGKQISFYIVANEGKLVKALMDLGIDFTEYHKFNFALKSRITLEEYFNPNINLDSFYLKLYSLLLTIKSDNENIKYLCGALIEALKEIKLDDERIQKKLNKLYVFLSLINSFIGAKIKFEYDAHVLAEEKEKKNDVDNSLDETKYWIIGIMQSKIIPMIQNLGLEDVFRATIFDSIYITLGIPKYQNGYKISIKLPGITNVIDNLMEEYLN